MPPYLVRLSRPQKPTNSVDETNGGIAMRQSSNGRNIACLVLVFAIIFGAFPAHAVGSQASATQAGSAFTVEDMLDAVNVNIADLSDDGRFIAAMASSLRDRIGIDNHRFGDPTY